MQYTACAVEQSWAASLARQLLAPRLERYCPRLMHMCLSHATTLAERTVHVPMVLLGIFIGHTLEVPQVCLAQGIQVDEGTVTTFPHLVCGLSSAGDGARKARLEGDV